MEDQNTFYDAGLKVRDGLEIDVLCLEQIIRLNRFQEVCRKAQSIPRRLGHPASRDELRFDKKAARKFGYLAGQVSFSWSKEVEGKTVKLSKEDKKSADTIGTLIDWGEWIEESRPLIYRQACEAVTWAIDNGYPQFAKRSAARFLYEQININRIAKQCQIPLP